MFCIKAKKGAEIIEVGKNPSGFMALWLKRRIHQVNKK